MYWDPRRISRISFFGQFSYINPKREESWAGAAKVLLSLSIAHKPQERRASPDDSLPFYLT
ncbi:hypothetical protein HI914_07088 [Erysiphe necator]|nr:hypothetical protein HI914_07088 [Erysiphe necator]